jgi:hypothetical protein
MGEHMATSRESAHLKEVAMNSNVTNRNLHLLDRLGRAILLSALAAVCGAIGAYAAMQVNSGDSDHLVVERLDIVEPDGSLAIALSNSRRVPSATIDGQVLLSDQDEERQIPMIVLFDGHGNEVGGLKFGIEPGGSGRTAVRSLTLDGDRQDEAIALFLRQDENGATSGLVINDRPTDLSLIDAMAQLGLKPGASRADFYRVFAEMPDEVRADKARELFGVQRIVLESNARNDAILVFNDGVGRPRLRMVVPEAGEPAIELLDEDQQVVASLPSRHQSSE